MCLKEDYFSLDQVKQLWNGTVGIEREALRVTPEGNLSPHMHQKSWGTRSHQPYIQTDFAESQIEFITPPSTDSGEIMNWLKALHQIVGQDIEEQGDLLWPFSTPAQIPQDSAHIKIAQLSDPKEYHYRKGLAQLYGKHVQLISGIHYNFMINPQVIQENFVKQDKCDNYIEFHNESYMHLTRNYFRYRWLLTYLIGGSPYVASNYNTNFYGTPHKERMRSIRQSHYGYQNKESVVIDYSDLNAFVESLENVIARGGLTLEKELYRDVRLRGAARSRELLTKGIQYLEFRNIDINPLLPYGIDEEHIDFIRLYLITMLFMEDLRHDNQVVEGHEKNYRIAEDDPLDPCPYKEEGLEIIAVMDAVARELDYPNWDAVHSRLIQSLDDPSLTLAGQIVARAQSLEEFMDLGLSLAEQHRENYLENPYLLHGFTQFELSTQDVLKEAIRRGIKVDMIDVQDNFLKFTFLNQVEYVRNGNMTSQDTLISYFAMENKVATKYILNQADLRVPYGDHFETMDQALAYYGELTGSGIVVKPKNTNYGIGISIFQTMPSLEEYEDALRIAFNEDETVLVEEYVSGTELRFYVQHGKTLAVVERRPAQVIGDGHSTIAELIEEENQNPFRGVKHMAPLTYLEQGEVEALQLRGQGLTFDSVPAKDQAVHLRENSNVSTGGISIDRTDDIHPSYKEIAELAAKYLDAEFCGVDIIIEDYHLPATENNYAIIEANYNPNITIHRFPSIGQPRYLGKAVLEQLFPTAFANK